MYGGLPFAGALGVGGASALTAKRDGFQRLATVVAASTLVMAGISLGKLLPRHRPPEPPRPYLPDELPRVRGPVPPNRGKSGAYGEGVEELV